MTFNCKAAELRILDEYGYHKDVVAPVISGAADGEKAVTFVACGDTGPVRNLESIAVQGGSAQILGQVKPILENADFVFANLEACFSRRGTPLVRVPVFRLDPAAFDVVKQARIQVVSLANNHMFDYGVDAFVDTLDLLSENDIHFFGAGANIEEALRPAIYEKNGVIFGFVGFRDREQESVKDNGVITPQMNRERILAAVSALKGRVDWVVVSLHFGLEYRFVPSPDDVQLCRQIIDHGANMIFGHHPHYPQGVEIYNNGLIAYSLGNFVWDQNFVGHTSSSYILQISVDKDNLRAVRVIPFHMSRDYQLRLSDKKEALAEIDAISFLLKDKLSHDREWYFVTRDHFQIFLKVIKKRLFSNRNHDEYSLFRWWMSQVGPRYKTTLKDFLKYVFTLKAFKFEIGQLWLKLLS